jgi:hypothetical protein
VSEQAVADPAADDECAPAGVADGVGDLDGALVRSGSRARPADEVNGRSSPLPVRQIGFAAEALDDAIAESRRERVEPHQRPRFEPRVHLRHRALDGARDRVGDRLGILPRAWPRTTVVPVSCDITSKNSVSVETGYTTLTWIAVPTSSERRHSARPTCANFVAAYAPMYGTPRLPTIDETMMMWPWRCRRNTRKRGGVRRLGADVVTSILSACSAVTSSMAPAMPKPALHIIT